MAAAKAVISVADLNSISLEGHMQKVRGTVAIDASPATYTAGGIAMNLAHPLIKATRAPKQVSVAGISGYVFSYIPGTDNTNGKLKVFVQDAVATNPLLEMADALAIPAGLSGDTVGFTASFLGQN